MSYSPIALTMPQYEDYPNYWIKGYAQGTTTPLSMATDAAAGTLLAKCELDINGFPKTTGNARFIPYFNAAYDLWLFPTEEEADADITVNAIQLADNKTAIVSVADISFTPEGIGAQTSNIGDILNEIVDIRRFGASTSNSDDTNNINNAITRAAAISTLIVVSGGTYVSDRTSQTLYIGDGRINKTNGDPNYNFINIQNGDTDKYRRPMDCVIRNKFNDDSVSISSVTDANTTVVVTTSSAHGFSNDDVIYISGISTGKTDINDNYYYVASVTSDTFKLINENGADIDGTNFNNYTTGGSVKSATGWAYIDDAGHDFNGFSTINTTGTPKRSIVLDYNFTSSKVGALLTGVDEQHAQDNIRLGPSVGLDSATYNLYQDLIGYIDLNVDPTQAYTPEFYGARPTVTDNGNGTLTVHHTSTGKQEAPVITLSTAKQGSVISSYDYLPKLYSFNTTTNDNFTIAFYDKLKGDVSYNGSSWDINVNSYLSAPTVTAFSVYLDIDFSSQITENFTNINITGIYNGSSPVPYLYNIREITTAGVVRVVITDYSGVIINPSTAASASMSFSFETNRVRMPIPDVGVVGFHRAGAILNPDYVVSDNANFWITGGMEV